MAELTSPLSGGLRAARTTVPSSVFGASAASNQEATNLLRANQNSLSVISTGILGIQQRVSVLGNSLSQISTQLTQESFLEQNRIRQEQEQERKLAEQQLREGKENLVERKIQSALVSPVRAISQRAQGVLEKLKGFFLTLLAGWLTNQAFETFRAAQEGATRKLEQIKNSVLTTLGIVSGIFLVMNGAFTRILGVIGGFTKTVLKAVTGAIFVKPLQMLAKAAKPVTAAAGAAAAATGIRGGRGPGLFGGALTGINALMNLRSGENIDAAVNAGGFIPGPIGAGLRVAGLLDDLAEIAQIRGGAGLFGEKPRTENKPGQPTTTTKTQPTDNKQETPPVPQAAPPSETSAAPVIQPQTAAIPPPPSAEMTQKFQMAWDNRNNAFARGRIESAWNEMSPEQQQQAKAWAQSKGYDWNEMKLSEKTAVVQAPPKVETPIGALPEPAPTIISAPEPPQQMSQPASQGSSAGSNVPAIPSSNSENFYILYSQMQYNVVG